MTARHFHFGGWRLDGESGDLERAGVRVRLQEQALSDGISQDIITEPSRWRQLEVRSRALECFDHIPQPNIKDAAYMAACHARLGNQDRAAALISEGLSRQAEFNIRTMMLLEPFREPADAAHLEESLRQAGLPE